MNSVIRDNVRPDSRNDNHSSVVSDLMSLIDHMQASMKLLEGAIASKLPLGDEEISENVVVLDDVTPCYLKANAALHTCRAGLEAALHFLTDTEAMIAASR
jgi:hypothetical protein